MNPDFHKLPPHLKRRIEFLIQEAINKSPRDQVISYCMRVISNHASIGVDAGSYKIKITNKIISLKAEALLGKSTSLKEWSDGCINEHQVPLKEIWDSLCSEGNSLLPSDVWNKFYSSKMVTITKEEDQILNSKGLRSESKNSCRYQQSGIEVVCLESSPRNFFGAHCNQRLK